MEQETQKFIDNVDAWIKQIRNEVSEITDVSHIVEENVGNVQHNYELIHELKEQLEQLKQEINALKLIQIVALRGKLNKKQ